ncbi:MAG TPA: UDP-3-O-(3-hydroxymyristoyl)glucosamine N-acyltransferase, partial [Myxococcales bacterium]|nr:UDP-3-O-(3-hydroxymyristoyl)glucosamine N-acyltransferase [Myxococcales bacterium]
ESIAPGALVHPTAQVGSGTQVEMGAIVQAGAQVGRDSFIAAGALVGRNASMGQQCCLHPGARLLHHCSIGNRVILHSGSVIGSDGFGYATDAEGNHHKIPQEGTVILEDDVEIGANTCIDRATFGATRIGLGTKIDNLVQIGHNVEIGAHSLIVSQAGIAGSTHLGAHVKVGAQAGIVGHLNINAAVTLTARAGATSDINEAGIYSCMPAIPHSRGRRVLASQKHLPDLHLRLQR